MGLKLETTSPKGLIIWLPIFPQGTHLFVLFCFGYLLTKTPPHHKLGCLLLGTKLTWPSGKLNPQPPRLQGGKPCGSSNWPFGFEVIYTPLWYNTSKGGRGGESKTISLWALGTHENLSTSNGSCHGFCFHYNFSVFMLLVSPTIPSQPNHLCLQLLKIWVKGLSECPKL